MLIDWALAQRALPGQGVSGDLHLVEPIHHGVLLGVVDGVGHGPEATLAAKIAVDTMKSHSNDSVHVLVKHCHSALKETRGVVLTVARWNGLDETMTWLGVGNVNGLLFRADGASSPACENVLQRGGLVGAQLPSLYAGVIPITPGDLLILASDGIRNDFEGDVVVKASPKRIADHILEEYFKGTDDALVLVARYLGLRYE